MRWPERPLWLLVPLTVTCLAWSTTSVLGRLTDAAPVGANTFTTTAWTCPSPGSGTVTATEDVWTDEQNPTTNTGGQVTTLSVQSRSGRARRSYVKFTLPTVPALCDVTVATLRLYNQTPTTGRTIEVYRAASSWLETTLTWTPQPTPAGTAVAAVTDGTAGWETWTVTTHVQTLYTGSDYGFVVKDQTETGGAARTQTYRSSEHATVANRPELVVTWG